MAVQYNGTAQVESYFVAKEKYDADMSELKENVDHHAECSKKADRDLRRTMNRKFKTVMSISEADRASANEHALALIASFISYLGSFDCLNAFDARLRLLHDDAADSINKLKLTYKKTFTFRDFTLPVIIFTFIIMAFAGGILCAYSTAMGLRNIVVIIALIAFAAAIILPTAMLGGHMRLLVDDAFGNIRKALDRSCKLVSEMAHNSESDVYTWFFMKTFNLDWYHAARDGVHRDGNATPRYMIDMLVDAYLNAEKKGWNIEQVTDYIHKEYGVPLYNDKT